MGDLIKRKINVWDKVEISRNQNRLRSSAYIEGIFEDFIELHGDRYFGDDSAIISGIGMLDGIPVTIIGQERGKSIDENKKRNYGMVNPEGYRKSLRLMRQAEKFNRPIVIFIDTPGAYCGVGAEQRGQGEAIAKNLFEIIDLKVPIISIIIGEGESGGALALAIADKIYMLENAIFSVASPEACSSILWKSKIRVKEAAEIMKITAEDLYDLKIIDEIILENNILEDSFKEEIINKVKSKILKDLKILMLKDRKKLLDKRYEKYRTIGL